MMNRKEPLHIFIHQSLKNVVEDFLVRTYLFSEKMKFEICYRIFNNNEFIKISK